MAFLNTVLLDGLVSFVSLTGAVFVIHKVHLERVAVIEDSLGVGRVVLELEALERGVVARFCGHNVDGRLSRPVGYREILGPFIRSCNIIIFKLGHLHHCFHKRLILILQSFNPTCPTTKTLIHR